jgi:uncharacterized protein (DUF924 family)
VGRHLQHGEGTMKGGPHPKTVLQFWFEELEPPQWWRKDPMLDQEISRRFGALHREAARQSLSSWRTDASGRLAEIIVLDQFSRNIHRGSPQAYSQDGKALGLAEEAVSLGLAEKLPIPWRAFLLMPYMHSESEEVHERALALFLLLESPPHLESELRHKAIVDRFGRYPHRNAVLGRDSTPEEQAFLLEPGSSF